MPRSVPEVWPQALAKGGAITGQASWLVIVGVIVVIAGLGGLWLRERLEQRRETRHRHR